MTMTTIRDYKCASSNMLYGNDKLYNDTTSVAASGFGRAGQLKAGGAIGQV